jgi:hypothetical protein
MSIEQPRLEPMSASPASSQPTEGEVPGATQLMSMLDTLKKLEKEWKVYQSFVDKRVVPNTQVSGLLEKINRRCRSVYSLLTPTMSRRQKRGGGGQDLDDEEGPSKRRRVGGGDQAEGDGEGDADAGADEDVDADADGDENPPEADEEGEGDGDEEENQAAARGGDEQGNGPDVHVHKAGPVRTAGAMAIRRGQRLLLTLLQPPLQPLEAVEHILDLPGTETLAQAEDSGFERLLRGYGDLQDLDHRDMQKLVRGGARRSTIHSLAR